MPSLPNPIGAVGSALGNAAASAATNAIDVAGEKIWQFAVLLLSGALDLLDRFAAPNVNPRSGPLAGLLPTTLWLGAVVALLLAFLQLGKAMASGGKGLGTLLIGLAQYAVITSAGLGFLAVLVTASDGLATGLLASGLGADSFGAIADKNSFWQDSAQAAGGLAMGLVALLCVIPAAFMLLIEALIRHAAILVLAVTVPILAAGLVYDSTARWFWTGLRWMVALLLLTPAVALVMAIGMQAARGSVTALSGDDPAAATVGMAVGGVTMLVALLCPLALFKLLAFMDPNTLSGGAVRGFLSGSSGASSSAPSAGGGAGSDSGAEGATESRFGTQLTAATAAGAAVADAASERGSQILDAAGAGHQGGSATKGRPSGRRPTSSNDPAPQGGEPDTPVSSDDDGGTPDGSDPERPAPPKPTTGANGTSATAGSGGTGAGTGSAAGSGASVATAEQAAMVAAL